MSSVPCRTCGLPRAAIVTTGSFGPCRCAKTGKAGDATVLRLIDSARTLHADKSGSYGTDADPLANFTAVAAVSGQPAWVYPTLRIVEKATRILSLTAQGRAGEVEELRDIAGLAFCAESLRQRAYPVPDADGAA